MAGPRATALIEELAKALELDGLALDDDGSVTLGMDGALAVSLAASPDDRTLTLFAPVATSARLGRDLLEQALAANFAVTADGRPVLALEPASRSLVLLRHLALDNLAYPDFEAALEAFANEVESWMAAAARAVEGGAGAGEAPAGFFDPTARA
jgi:glycine/D-amino acid oxidase-like deaminating enzyme